MYRRLRHWLARLSPRKPETLQVLLTCPCGECETKPWSPDMAPDSVTISDDGTRVEVYDLCPPPEEGQRRHQDG
jgi:hypothetical protein